MKKNIIKMGYTDESGYHCTWHTVVDTDATNAKIAECENKWQDEIDTCTEQIQQYQDLMNEIDGKISEANALQAEFNANSASMADAGITHPDATGAMASCEDCFQQLQAAYEGMKADCSSAITDWESKKSQAESKKGSCPADTPKVYKDVCD